MYIARHTLEGKKRYTIRESYLKGGVYLSRDLMDLGETPHAFIRYPQGRSFYIHETVTEHLHRAGVRASQEELEEIFWPYIRPDIKRRYETARSRSFPEKRKHIPLGKGHLFDTRRLHFLRFGNMSQSGIHNTPPALLEKVAGKSRDEIEQYFILEEMILPAHEIKHYVHVIFDLQRHFSQPFARQAPHALDQKEVERHFLKNLCRLNKDPTFWPGMKTGHFLHDYLKRYAIMFFDADYPESRYLEELLFKRINRQRYARQRQRPRRTIVSEASRLFGIPEDELQAMSKRQITRIYRRKARELHPDRGGSHDAFVHLSRVYHELLETKA